VTAVPVAMPEPGTAQTPQPWAPSRALTLVWLTCAVAAAGFAAHGIYRAMELWRAAPFYDEWAGVEAYRAWIEGRFGLSELLAQHNEHRIPFTRLMYVADFAFFRGQAVFSHLTNLAAYIGLGAALGTVAAWRDEDRAGRAMVIAASIAFTLAPTQIGNLAFAFQIQMALVCLFAVVAFFATARLAAPATPRAQWAWTAVAATAAFLVSFTSANGFIASLMTAALAWVLAIDWRARVIVTAAAALSLAAFFHGFSFVPGNPRLFEFLDQPGGLAKVADYIAALLGSLGQAKGVETAIRLGMAGVALWAAAAVLCVLLWRRGALDAAATALLVTAGFMLATALVIGLGRGTGGPLGALSSRYGTFGAVFLASLLGLAWRLAGRMGTAWLSRMVVVAGTAWLLVIASRLPYEYPPTLWHVGKIDVATAELRAGVFDPEHVKALYPDPEHVRPLIEFLRARRLSFFAD
jgi:hypothetical protein